MISFGFIWPLLLGAMLCLSSGYAGYHMRDLSAKQEIADGKAAFARHIGAANKNTRATKEKLAGEVKTREAKIDEWKSKYDDLLAKSATGVCALDDDDVRFDVRSKLRPRAAGNPRPKS